MFFKSFVATITFGTQEKTRKLSYLHAISLIESLIKAPTNKSKEVQLAPAVSSICFTHFYSQLERPGSVVRQLECDAFSSS